MIYTSFEKHQIENGKESRIMGSNENGHVRMEGIIDGKRFSYDNSIPHKVFRKTPHPRGRRRRISSKKTRRERRNKGNNKSRRNHK